MNFTSFPFIRYLLFFIIGLIGYWTSNFFHYTFYAVLIGLIILLIIGIYTSKNHFRGIVLWMICICSGWILAYQKTDKNNNKHYTNQGEFLYYQAIVQSNPEEKNKTFKVEAKVKAIRSQANWQESTGKVLLYFNKETNAKPAYGDIFLIKNMPREVEAPKNPEEFDYRKYLSERGIYRHHFIWGKEAMKIGHQEQSYLLAMAYRLNQYADSVFRLRLVDKQDFAVASAMVVGIRDDIDNELLNAYAASGAIHVLSVSGMHVGILFLFLGWMLAWLKKRGKYGKIAFTMSVITILWAYAIFTGLSSTVLRATVMFSFIQIGTALNRRQNIYNTLAISALLLLCVNPYWLLDVGFQLSYLAIIGIVWLYPYLNQLFSPKNLLIRNVWEGTCVCIAAQLTTFPLSLYYFHQFPTYFLIANPFVAFFSFAVLPAGLALLFFNSIPIISGILTWILKYSLVCLNKSIFLMEALPYSTLKGFSINIPETLLIYSTIACIVLFLLKSEIKYLKWTVIWIITLFGLNLWQDWQQSGQHTLTFHFIPKKSGISIIDGKSATFLSDSFSVKNERLYDFHLKNYFDKKGVVHKNFVATNEFQNREGMTMLETEKNRILWIQKKFKGKLSGQSDYILLSNNSIKKLYPTFENFRTKLIILDDSNKRYVVESLKRQADSLSIPLLALYEHGAFTIENK